MVVTASTPLVALKRVLPDGYIELHELAEKFPFYYDVQANVRYKDAKVTILLYKVYNENGEVIAEINRSFILDVESVVKYRKQTLFRNLSRWLKRKGYDKEYERLKQFFTNHYALPRAYIGHVCRSLSIPMGSYLLIAIINGYLREFGKEKYFLVPGIGISTWYDDLVDKIRSDAEYFIETIKHSSFHKIFLPFANTKELTEVSHDLLEAIIRYNKKDYDGSIKFFRKVIEGIRNYLNKVESIDEIEKRADALLDYVRKAYHLVSNFGEHYKTYGGPEEAELTKNIALSLAGYIALKIKSNKIRMKKSVASTSSGA